MRSQVRTQSSGLSAGADALADMIDFGVRIGRDVLGALRSERPGTRTVALVRDAVGATPVPSLGALRLGTAGGCEIPPPCWVPEQLETVRSHGCPGATARVRLRVTNCGATPRTVTVRPTGPDAESVRVEPSAVTLGPYEEGTLTASVTLPDDEGERKTTALQALLWVSGCRDHVLLWRIENGDGCSTLHEVDVEDCPDLVHHWYDHFYCQRPCPSRGRGQGG